MSNGTDVEYGIQLRTHLKRAMEKGYSFILSGPHGIGKTAALLTWAAQMADRFKVKYIPLAGLSREDLVIPFPGERHGEPMVVYLKHEMLDDYDERDGRRKPIILILDEFNRHQDGQIYNALLELMQVRSMAGAPINLHCVIGLANPSDDTRYFNTVELEQTVLDRFQLYFYADGYDLGADEFLLRRFPDTAPVMIEWYHSLPAEKRWLVPPRRQHAILQAVEDGFPVRTVFPAGVDLPIEHLVQALHGGSVWTLARIQQDPAEAVEQMEKNPALLPLFFALLRAVGSTEVAREVSPLVWALYPPVRAALLSHNPNVWEPVFLERGQQRMKEREDATAGSA